LLPDELVEGARAHAGGEGASARRQILLMDKLFVAVQVFLEQALVSDNLDRFILSIVRINICEQFVTDKIPDQRIIK
jgi:hypothetical protein